MTLDVAVDATLLVRDGADERALSIEDLATGATGAATETTLAAVLTELGGKLEAADLTTLATAAKQDAARAVLETIASALAGTLSVSGTVATDGLTDAQLRAAPVPVDVDFPASQPVTGTLALDAPTLAALEQVTATVPGTVSVTGPLTNDELRAAPLDVAGTLTVANPTADPETGLAKDATLGARYAGGKQAAVATVTASGNTTLITPAPGNLIRLFWISAINDPDEASSPLIRVLLGADEVYRGYAISHWEIFEGAVDAPLEVNLSGAASVAVTAHYTEITP